MGICRRDEDSIRRELFKGRVFSCAFSNLDQNDNQNSQFWLAEVFPKVQYFYYTNFLAREFPFIYTQKISTAFLI